MRKFLLVCLIFVIMLFQQANASEIFKINGVKFDTSSAVLFINTSGSYISSITDKIKLTQIPNENRVFFDIDSSVLLSKKQDLCFSDGNIKEIKIGQFSTKPSVVRIVIYFNNGYNTDNLKIGNINNNLVITTADIPGTNAQFYQNTYRDSSQSVEDYSEDLVVQSKSTVIQNNFVNVNDQKHTVKQLSQIQQAFGTSTIGDTDLYKNAVMSNVSDSITLRSKYYLKSIEAKDNGFLINGYGAVTIQKPFILTEPTRMVFDFANTDLNKYLNNKEILLNNSKSDSDRVKISQYSGNITRVVITANDAKKYIPVFSSDNQSLLLVNPAKVSANTFSSERTNAVHYLWNKNISTDDLTIRFTEPVIWGIKRNSDVLYIYFFNAVQYNEHVFESSIKNTPFSDSKMSLLKNIGIRLAVPLNDKSDVCTYLSSDGKSFRIRVSNLGAAKKVKRVKKEEQHTPKIYVAPIIPTAKGRKSKSIVLDPGHGGTDYGAIRDGINEKDINLDVAKRVEAILKRNGFAVYMTRTTDIFVSLADRCTFTTRMRPNMFVSIHVNSCMGTEPRGIETHYYHDDSIPLANAIHNKLARAVSSPNRGLFKSRFYVINHTTVPAVLVEIGFISNDKERAALTTPQYKQTIAEAIAEGIIEFYNSQK